MEYFGNFVSILESFYTFLGEDVANSAFLSKLRHCSLVSTLNCKTVVTIFFRQLVPCTKKMLTKMGVALCEHNSLKEGSIEMFVMSV